MITTITYLDDADKKQVRAVTEEQYDFRESLPGLIIRPWPTALLFIPQHRILSIFTTNCDADVLDNTENIPEPLHSPSND